MTVVGTVADFPAGTHRIVTVDGREVGVFNIAGRLYGLANRCAHQGGPLCAAKRTTGTLVAEPPDYKPRWALEGEIVACPWHGLEYHVPTGQCLADSRIRDPPLRRDRRRRRRGRHPRIHPPSTSSVWPVTKPASSPAKNAIARATSSTSPRRLSDCASSTPRHSAS